ncbi:putative mfs monocarboxylate transporter protein [Neofusicoccum parvum UCRNP2]|uniref:Putative mfs monocarboxylate transporter protein n=1 Tax=Botryosphaeria parva (strain UCR-NP2) TaxID=1287680 RepID=R1FWP6_BOTPV|nr:putative mfs monocarboxylate transporter protein [Neofusicoccum parvum UCRNP2]
MERHQSSDANEKKDDKIEVKLPGRPHSAYIVRDLGYSTYDYHKALCHIRKKEDCVQRKREKAIRAFAIDTDYHVPSTSSRNSTHTLLQTSSNGSKDTKAGTTSSNEALKTEPSWASSSTMVSVTGGITYTLTVAYVLPKVGFEWTYRILSLIMITTMLFPTFVLRPWCGEQKMKASKVISTRGLLDFSFLLMLLGMFLSFWALYFPYFYITTYATTTLSLHPSPGHVCSFLITLLAATFPGRILPALVSDRFIGPLTTLIPSALLSATFIYLWTGIRTKAPFYLLTGLYGFSSAAIVTLYAPTSLAFARQPAADFVLVTHKGQETGSAGMKGGDGVNTKKTPFTNFRSI